IRGVEDDTMFRVPDCLDHVGQRRSELSEGPEKSESFCNRSNPCGNQNHDRRAVGSKKEGGVDLELVWRTFHEFLVVGKHGPSPAIPVSETIPPVDERPCACVARSKSRQVAPPSAVAIFRDASTRTVRIKDRSTTKPPSQTAVPDTPWPPPRTESGIWWLRAKS